MPFRPLREKDAERLVLYGVLSLLNRILADDQRMRGPGRETTHIAIDAVDHVSGRQVGDLGICLRDMVREHLYERLPLFLRLPEHGF